MIELRLIQHALALARHRNFARAAHSLHLTQPTMTRSIAALERAVGVQLFDRSAKGVEPTAFGSLLLERGARLLAGEADLRREVQLLAGLEAGRLAVIAGPFPFEISVGAAVARLLAAHPRLRVRAMLAEPTEVVRDVLARRADVGLVDLQFIVGQTDLVAESMPRHDFIVACRPGHPLAGRTGLSLADVLSFPMASTRIVNEAVTSAVTGAGTQGLLDVDHGELIPSIHVNSYAVARQIACDTDALVPGTVRMLAHELAAGRLVRLDFRMPGLHTNYAIIRRQDRSLSPAARAFIDLVRDVEADVVATTAHGATQARRRVHQRHRRKKK
ncbi:MAG: LysR family transcriptional regulator [Gammaproteobacteria bacterium]|nr:LysR family transcriptional regulator [Gammaproteobacteria bacterium]